MPLSELQWYTRACFSSQFTAGGITLPSENGVKPGNWPLVPWIFGLITKIQKACGPYGLFSHVWAGKHLSALGSVSAGGVGAVAGAMLELALCADAATHLPTWVCICDRSLMMCKIPASGNLSHHPNYKQVLSVFWIIEEAFCWIFNYNNIRLAGFVGLLLCNWELLQENNLLKENVVYDHWFFFF